MKQYRFFELTKEAQQRAYLLYCAAMDDDLNRDDIVSMRDYGALANYEDLRFYANGNAI